MRGFIDKEVSMENISEMWPKFLLWIDEYVGCGINGSAKAQYSREDMRYAYQAGYELSKWISVEDRLPEEGEEVLVYCKWDNSCLIAFHDGSYWTEKCDNLEVIGDSCSTTEIQKVGVKDTGCEITHWQPMIELPK